MAVQNSYTDRMPVAQAGMIADTSLRQVDGATAALNRIYAGRPVVIVAGDNNTKSVRGMTSADLTALAGKGVGIAVFSHWACYRGYYDVGDAVNVMRVGRIWAITNLSSAPGFGDPVSVLMGTNPAEALVSNTGGTAIPGWSFTGSFETQPDGSHIAEVELTIQQIAAAPAS